MNFTITQPPRATADDRGMTNAQRITRPIDVQLEDEMADQRHPQQPIVLVNGVARFKKNAIVDHLLTCAREGKRCDLNDIARMDFSQEDREQFAQLIGYSLCGYHELSDVSDESALAASASCGYKGCRDTGCEMHIGVARERTTTAS